MGEEIKEEEPQKTQSWSHSRSFRSLMLIISQATLPRVTAPHSSGLII